MQQDKWKLTEKDFTLFNREMKQFAQLKQFFSADEIEWIKKDYKATWDLWKAIHLTAYEQIQMQVDLQKPKVESWTNGWQVRGHYWVSYRTVEKQMDATCLGILLNRKNLRVNLLWQQYKKKQSLVTANEYNEKLAFISTWAETVNPTEYFIWTTKQGELEDYLPLTTYLTQPAEQARIQTELVAGETFQVGKILPKQSLIQDVEQWIAKAILELYPLYLKE